MNVDQVLPPSADRVLSEVQVAERLGVSLFTVRAWRHRGMGPRFMKMGRAVRYRSRDVEAFKNERLLIRLRCVPEHEPWRSGNAADGIGRTSP